MRAEHACGWRMRDTVFKISQTDLNSLSAGGVDILFLDVNTGSRGSSAIAGGCFHVSEISDVVACVHRERFGIGGAPIHRNILIFLRAGCGVEGFCRGTRAVRVEALHDARACYRSSCHRYL